MVWRPSFEVESTTLNFNNNPLSASISYSNESMKREELEAEFRVEQDVWLCRLLFLFGL